MRILILASLVYTLGCSADCASVGGVCSAGGRCPSPAAGETQRYPDSDGSRGCPGGGSAGAVCCVTCHTDSNTPGICCSATASFIPICVGGNVGCPPGETGKPGETCN